MLTVRLMVWSKMSTADGDELNLTITGDVLQNGNFKFASTRPSLYARLLPDDLLDKSHLLNHELDVGVAPIVGFFLDADDR
jgi:hypothetical protein